MSFLLWARNISILIPPSLVAKAYSRACSFHLSSPALCCVLIRHPESQSLTRRIILAMRMLRSYPWKCSSITYPQCIFVKVEEVCGFVLFFVIHNVKFQCWMESGISCSRTSFEVIFWDWQSLLGHVWRLIYETRVYPELAWGSIFPKYWEKIGILIELLMELIDAMNNFPSVAVLWMKGVSVCPNTSPIPELIWNGQQFTPNEYRGIHMWKARI